MSVGRAASPHSFGGFALAGIVKERCIVIPAIKKNAVIPDQLVKKLAGTTLIERALNTARACAKGEDIITLTDSEEIGIICQRYQTRHLRDPKLRFHTWDIVAEMRDLLSDLASEYTHCIILRPSCPLLTWVDIDLAWKRYLVSGASSLITVRNVRQRLWRSRNAGPESLLAEAGRPDEQNYVVETRALIILNLDFLRGSATVAQKTIPYFLNERGLEILGYQDWWICERLLERRKIVFVVAGYPSIGMGHVYRALMLAHEISAHKISFVCTAESGLAVESVASRDYPVTRQGDEPLYQTVIAQQPDLVINDFLNTNLEYMRKLVENSIRCVNFEDEGPGAALASLVINALYDQKDDSSRVRCGPDYFCLRDEFVNAERNPLRPKVSTLLITFGGTDQHNATERVLNLVEPICRLEGIAIRIVAGPGYAHKEKLEQRLAELANPFISFTWATNIMSRMMEGADLAICSTGRTVYELAHMRVPGLALATHAREATHPFARVAHGFAFAGIMDRISDAKILKLFLALLNQKRRALYWHRQNRLSFTGNKQRVVGLMLDQLEKTEEIL